MTPVRRQSPTPDARREQKGAAVSDDDRPRDSGAERRRHERYPTAIDVDCESGDTFLFASITNISEMGIFVRSATPLPVGTKLTLRFAGSDGKRLELQGTVAWVNPLRPDGDNPNPGMGVRFGELTATTRERLVDLVRTIAYLRDDDEYTEDG
jgi:type IV pilus assembly protein PilZ